MKKRNPVGAQPADPVEQTILTDVAPISSPVVDAADSTGTITATPAAEPEAAPAEPITKPEGGGSYVRDRATGHLTRQEA